jgi:uncharacterized membrane protein
MTRPHTTTALVRLFDIRTIVAALLAVYGLLLTIAGLVPAVLRPHEDKAAAANRVQLYIGTDANWWVGLILLGVAAVFFTWAVLRPVPVEEVEQAVSEEGSGLLAGAPTCTPARRAAV